MSLPTRSNHGSRLATLLDDVVGGVFAANGDAKSTSPDASQRAHWNDLTGTAGGDIIGGLSAKRGASAVSTSWALGGSKPWATVATPLKPASGPTKALTGAGVTVAVAVIDSGLLQDGGGSTRIKTTRDLTTGVSAPPAIVPVGGFGHGTHVGSLIGSDQIDADVIWCRAWRAVRQLARPERAGCGPDQPRDQGDSVGRPTPSCRPSKPRCAAGSSRAQSTPHGRSSNWLVSGVAESTVVDGQDIAWANHIIWDDNIVWGTNIYSNSLPWADNIVWGTLNSSDATSTYTSSLKTRGSNSLCRLLPSTRRVAGGRGACCSAGGGAAGALWGTAAKERQRRSDSPFVTLRMRKLAPTVRRPLVVLMCFMACAFLGPVSYADAQTPAAQGTEAGVDAEIAELKERLSDFERRLVPAHGSESAVDLSDDEVSAASVSTPDDGVDQSDGSGARSAVDASVASQPWFRNVRLSGFAGLEYVDAGRSSTRPFGGVSIRESTLFVDAAAWEHVSMFLEVQVNRLGKDKELFVRTGEVYAHWRNLLKRWGADLLSLKVGRIDIPFGEDYLWQDAIDNPLISFSAAYPYGFDEGVVAYGRLRGLRWIAAVTDGTDDRSVEENGSKAVNVKVSGRPHPALYVSSSAMRTGRTSESALEFGGSHIEPVGVGAPSSVGRSPSSVVSAALYQVDATISPYNRAALALSFGTARIDDDADAFDRDVKWWSVEPRYQLGRGLYVVARYSEIGSYDDARGFHFDGKTTAGGNAAFGYDTRRFQRLSAGVGFRPNPRTLLKAEVGQDWFKTIATSPFDAGDDDRTLFGFALAVGF